jgi:hypothetical protein
MDRSWGTNDPDNAADAEPASNDRPWFGGVPESRRREAIVSLVEATDGTTPYTVGELTVTLSEWFRERTDGGVPTDEEIHSVLYDFDLPRLDADGRLVFDRETGRVFATDTARSRGRSVVPRGIAGDFALGRALRPANRESERPGGGAVSLGVLFVAAAGVVASAVGVGPLTPSYVLVPPAVVVLFFAYRSIRRT